MERLYSDDQEAMFVEAQVWKEADNFTQTMVWKYNFIQPLLLGHLPFQEEA